MAAIVPFAALIAMVVVLADYAVPSVKYNGILHFITSSTWSFGNLYGAIPRRMGCATFPAPRSAAIR